MSLLLYSSIDIKFMFQISVQSLRDKCGMEGGKLCEVEFALLLWHGVGAIFSQDVLTGHFVRVFVSGWRRPVMFRHGKEFSLPSNGVLV